MKGDVIFSIDFIAQDTKHSQFYLAQKTTELPELSQNWGHSQFYLIKISKQWTQNLLPLSYSKQSWEFFSHGINSHTVDFFLIISLGLADLKICLNMGYGVTKTKFLNPEQLLIWYELS